LGGREVWILVVFNAGDGNGRWEREGGSVWEIDGRGRRWLIGWIRTARVGREDLRSRVGMVLGEDVRLLRGNVEGLLLLRMMMAVVWHTSWSFSPDAPLSSSVITSPSAHASARHLSSAHPPSKRRKICPCQIQSRTSRAQTRRARHGRSQRPGCWLSRPGEVELLVADGPIWSGREWMIFRLRNVGEVGSSGGAGNGAFALKRLGRKGDRNVFHVSRVEEMAKRCDVIEGGETYGRHRSLDRVRAPPRFPSSRTRAPPTLSQRTRSSTRTSSSTRTKAQSSTTSAPSARRPTALADAMGRDRARTR
jgi:hypothetical protein